MDQPNTRVETWIVHMGDNEVHLGEALGHPGHIDRVRALHVVVRGKRQRAQTVVKGHGEPVTAGKVIDTQQPFLVRPARLIGEIDLQPHYAAVLQAAFQGVELRRYFPADVDTGAQEQPLVAPHGLFGGVGAGHGAEFFQKLHHNGIAAVREKYSSRICGLTIWVWQSIFLCISVLPQSYAMAGTTANPASTIFCRDIRMPSLA